MKKILYTTSLVSLPSSFKRLIYGGNIMLYRISVVERGLTGIANIFRSRLSKLDDLLRAGTVPLRKRLLVTGHEYRKMGYRAALRWGCSCENRFVSRRWHPFFNHYGRSCDVMRF